MDWVAGFYRRACSERVFRWCSIVRFDWLLTISFTITARAASFSSLIWESELTRLDWRKFWAAARV